MLIVDEQLTDVEAGRSGASAGMAARPITRQRIGPHRIDDGQIGISGGNAQDLTHADGTRD